MSRPTRPHQPDQAAYGWYQPDAPTVEMPAIDERALREALDRDAHLRRRPREGIDEPGVQDRDLDRRDRRRDRARDHRRPPAPPPAPSPGPPTATPPVPPDAPGTATDTAATRAVQVERSQRASAVVAAGIGLSRLAGLLREMVVSASLGVGAAADAFKAALQIPNFLQNLLGEGVLSASFIPVYARLRKDGHEEEAGRLAGAVAGLLLALTGVLCVTGVLLAGLVARLITPGFRGERYDLTVELVRLMFPGIGLLVLSAWCLGVLNSHKRFFLSYVAPVLWNAAQITAVVAVALRTDDHHSRAVALAWGVLAGGVLQLAVQLGPVLRLLGRLRLSFDARRSSVRLVLRRFMPMVVGRGVVQIMTYVDIALASFLARGAVAALNFSQVLYVLPISLFATSVAAAELPELSQIDVHDPTTRRTYRRRLEDGMARIMFYVAPSATLFIVVGDVIVRLAYQRGSFGPSDTWLVWLVLATFATGLPAATSSRLLQNGLYALNDTRTPARLAVVRVVIAAGVGLGLMFPFDRLTLTSAGIDGWGDMWVLRPLADRNTEVAHLGIVALAIGASLGAWVEYRMLSRALAWRIGRTRLAGRWLNPIAASCAVAAAAAYGMVVATPDGLPSVLVAVAVLAPAGLAYLGMTYLLQVPEAESLVRRVGRLAARGRR